MPSEFKHIRRVDFSDTDLAGIVHFPNFFKYLEAAEHAFFRSLGWSIVMDKHDPPLGWPRVHVSCDYLAPLKFEDEVETHLLISRITTKSLTYVFRMRKLNTRPPVEVAKGKLTVVCVTRDSSGTFVPLPIPPDIARKLEVAPETHLHPPPAHAP